VAALGAGIYVQLLTFAVFTLISLFWVRPFARRYLHKGEDNRVSNADALLGRQGRVVETIKADGFGRVQIDGDIWKAVTNESADIPEGANVRVVGRESTIIRVVIED
jgi:membrane protein implicated in regulation of membrane protease activity